MGAPGVRPGPRLAGRGVEQQLLAEALWGAVSGQPCAVVVHGEAGVGKTRLVRDACYANDGRAPQVEVLWGTCVHFGEASVPFAPVIGALQAWQARTDDATCADVLAGAGELGTLLPALGDARTGEHGRLLPLIDMVIDRIADRGPTVVVIDDLHWADRSSLDVLAYLITGFRDQHLALVATCRDEHRGEGHPLHGWLADMRRMPRFAEIHLDRLDLAGTEAQVQDLLRRAVVDIGFVTQVQERSGGNPYLTELLVRGLSGTETHLPATAPAALRDALLARWHGLSAASRQTSRVLAVGGRPLEFAVLAEVAREHEVAPELLSGCLIEAQDHGVIGPDGEGRPWFRHPLLAEVLYDAMPPGEAARVHATYVRALNALSDGATDRVAADLAVHNHRAGRVDDAYRWSMIAADCAAELHATSEEAIHLARACSLWEHASPDVRGTSADRVDLLRRASHSCGRAGRSDMQVELLELALPLVDRNQDPLLASTLLVAWSGAMHERTVLGTTVANELIEAVRLTEAFPDSPEHALALAELAFAEYWDRLHDEATIHAEQAVRAALRSGSEFALAGALSARALVERQDHASSLADAREAKRLARSCGATTWLQNSAIWEVNSLVNLGRTAEATAVARDAFEEVVADGSEFAYFLASSAAEGLLWLGRWNECHDLLREALAARCGNIASAAVRLAAAQLAARRGRVAEAQLHLERTRELIPTDHAGLYSSMTVATAEVLLSAGKAQQALEWLHSRIVVPSAATPSVGEDILADFVHAAAECAQEARDAGDDQSAARAVAMLDDLIDRWPGQPFTSPRPDVVDQAMAKALFDAEVARCRGEPNQAERWQHAIQTSHAAGVPWQEATSRLRCAGAMLADGLPPSAVTELLRQAHSTAVELGAQPLQEQIQALARIARITLREPTPIPDEPAQPTTLAALTPREREILAFLVAGRSNREIAKALVISDKTVSVHVTNILRKTGTATRLEVAALAERLEQQHLRQHACDGSSDKTTR